MIQFQLLAFCQYSSESGDAMARSRFVLRIRYALNSSIPWVAGILADTLCAASFDGDRSGTARLLAYGLGRPLAAI